MKTYTIKQQLKNADKYINSLQDENRKKMMIIIALVNKLGGKAEISNAEALKASKEIIKYENKEFNFILTIEDR